MARSADSLKQIIITLRSEEYEVLRVLASKNKTSVAGVIRDLIRERIEEEEDIRDGRESLEDKNGTMEWEVFKKRLL